jgi:hypothetical protein
MIPKARRDHIRRLRQERDRHLDEAKVFARESQKAVESIDLREQIRANPELALGTAAAAGFPGTWLVGSSRLRHVLQAATITVVRRELINFAGAHMGNGAD